MKWEPFLGSRIKIERANRHIADLNSVITRFIDRDPYRIVVEHKADAGRDYLILRARESLPNRIPAILGDAIHNLRVSLDYLAIDLVKLNRGNINDVKFPFCAGPDDLEGMLRKRHMHRAAHGVVEIIRSLKPYRGGNEALRAIHDLDILDKHELLLAFGYIANVPSGLLYRSEDKAANTKTIHVRAINQDWWVGPLDDGAEIEKLAKGHNLEVGQEFEATVDIAFGDGQPFEREPIIKTLHKFSHLTTSILNRFEAYCLGA